jgi:hypothetical protein
MRYDINLKTKKKFAICNLYTFICNLELYANCMTLQLYSWLVGVGEAFVQGHQDMGSVLAMAQDFLELHRKLLHDLKVSVLTLKLHHCFTI